MKYKAKLTGNRRGVHQGNPMCLIIDIDPSDEIARDHCWVEINEELERIQPSGHQKPITIQFEAEIKEYTRRKGQAEEQDKTFHKITNIKRIR